MFTLQLAVSLACIALSRAVCEQGFLPLANQYSLLTEQLFKHTHHDGNCLLVLCVRDKLHAPGQRTFLN